MKVDYDIVVIGAGASGVGMGQVLKDLGIKSFLIIERHEVGASFRRWPKEMRFISPSFTGNAFGQLDLNAVALETSPAYTLEVEHPSGRQFAEYLQLIVDQFKLPVRTGVDVLGIEVREFDCEKSGTRRKRPSGKISQTDELTASAEVKVKSAPASARVNGFAIRTSAGIINTRFVVWAAGEFQYPKQDGFPGVELCVHNSSISSWRQWIDEKCSSVTDDDRNKSDVASVDGDAFVVIGGGESGIDSAVNLVRFQKNVSVIDSGEPWGQQGSDPSQTLSPYTIVRLERALRSGRLRLIGKARVKSVSQRNGLYEVSSKTKKWQSAHPPILASGFTGSLHLIKPLFAWQKTGHVELTDCDESTLTPGLFVTGPLVRHDGVIFCFIYKFRQRFAVVANAIAQSLHIETEALDKYRKSNMFLDDLSCCEAECAC